MAGLRTAIHALLFPHVPASDAACRWGEAAGIVTLVAVCAVAADNLCFVFQIVGSTCGALLMFILPAAMFVSCRHTAAAGARGGGGGGAAAALPLGFAAAFAKPAAGGPDHAERGRAWAVLAVGLVIFVGSTAASLYGAST